MSQLDYSPGDFADPEFAEECAACFDTFIELIVEGIPRDLAIIDAFQMIRHKANLMNADALALAAQCNPYVKTRLAAKLKAAKPEDLWDANKAINALLKLLRSDRTKDSTKLLAIDRLNVLLGITEVDEAGRTRKTPTLGDLYGSMQASADMPYSDVRDDIERVRAAGLRQAEAEAKAKKGRTLQ